MDIKNELNELQSQYINHSISNEELELKCNLLGITSNMLKNLTTFNVDLSYCLKPEKDILIEIFNRYDDDSDEYETYIRNHNCNYAPNIKNDQEMHNKDKAMILFKTLIDENSNRNVLNNFLLNHNLLELIVLYHASYQYKNVDMTAFKRYRTIKNYELSILDSMIQYFLKYDSSLTILSDFNFDGLVEIALMHMFIMNRKTEKLIDYIERVDYILTNKLINLSDEEIDSIKCKKDFDKLIKSS